jgi:Kef-type K+ transport system membrane component KefB
VRKLVTLVVLMALTFAILEVGGGVMREGRESFLLGFLLLAAYLAGHVSHAIELPRITGYLLLGILVGPFMLGLLPRESVVDFRLINGGALSLIALAAGGELRIEAVKKRALAISSIITAQVVVVCGVVVAAVWWGRGLVPFLKNTTPGVTLAVGMIFGLVAVAKSPATTIAIITEERARGVLTETVLGITVMKDVVVLVLVALVIPVAAMLADPSTPFALDTVKEVLLSIGYSVGAGVLMGFLLALYLARVHENQILVVLVAAFLLVEVSDVLGLEHILVAMTAGFGVQNFSRQGARLLRALEANALPVYALFFAVAGADLRIDLLPRVWTVAVGLSVVRALALAGSTWLGARAVHDPPVVRRWAWMGFLAQAGVTLGIANIVRDRFPVWGGDVATVIIAMIALNQIVGPPAFRLSLVRADESHRTSGGLSASRARELGLSGA